MEHFLKDLLDQGSINDPNMAAQIRMAARSYIAESEKKASEFVRKEAEFKTKEAEFKTREEKYLTEIVNLTNQHTEKDKFFSIVAHDLRGPLTSFLGLSQAIKEDLDNLSIKDLQNLADEMHRSAKNLFQLLENLLEWSKARTNRTELNLKKVSLFETILRVENLYSESARIKGVSIRNEVPTGLTLNCDNHMLETILRNLVGNAVKFCSKGNKITVSADQIAGGIEFSVADTGIGMNREMVQNIFALSSKAQRPGTAGELSIGLGLLLCKEFVEKHGGKIWVESKEGTGSVFHFTIPLNPTAILLNRATASN